MTSRWVIVVAVVGCGGGTSGKEKAVCEHAAKLCGAEDDVASCTSDLSEAKKAMGDQYAKFLDCSLAASSCGEYVGCAVGGLGNEALDQLEGFGAGMKKMMKDKVSGVTDRVEHGIRHALDDDEALPTACARLDKICAADDPFVRKHCRRLVGNLGEDTAHLAELTTCLEASKNCFAADRCIDELQDKLRGF